MRSLSIILISRTEPRERKAVSRIEGGIVVDFLRQLVLGDSAKVMRDRHL
jgi:hypothetical protein